MTKRSKWFEEGSRRKQFLAPEQLDRAAAELAAIATAERVHTALIGGYALQLYGSPRLTGDVDIAAEERLAALPPGKTLSFGGEQTVAPSGVPVGVVVRDDDLAPLYEDAIARATRIRGVPLPVARPEHLAAMKMASGRTLDELDLEFLLATGLADRAKTRRLVRKFLGAYGAVEFDRTADEVEWKKTRGEASYGAKRRRR